MKNGNIKKAKIVSYFAILMSLLLLPSFTADAGLSRKIIDTTLYKTELDESDWYNNDGDITVKNGVFTFPDSSTASTKLMSKAVVEPSMQVESMLDASFSIDFSKLPEGEKFAFVVGLQTLQAEMGQQGNVELIFQNEGGTYKAAVEAYAEEQVVSSLGDAVSCGKGRINATVSVSTKKTLEVTVGGKRVYKGDIPVSGSGSVGFLQTGSCGAKVSNLMIKTFEYHTPEAPSFMEDFETGYFNSNTLLSKQIQGSEYIPSYTIIEEFGDNKALLFKNAGMGYIGTKYQYSNFELTFDVIYSQNKPELDEQGNTLSPETNILGLAYGSDGNNHESHEGYTSAANMFCIGHSGDVYCIQEVDNTVKSSFKAPTGTFSVRLTVLDGVVTLSMKQLNGTSYQDVYKYTENVTPTGNILIWVPSGCVDTWAIDNIAVTNKDVDGKDFNVDFKSSKIEIPEDFQYEPLGYEYNPDKTIEAVEKGPSINYFPIVLVSAVCVIILVITGVAVGIKAKKRKRGVNLEK